MSETISLKKRSQKKVTVHAAKIKHGLKTGRIKILEKKIKRRMKGTGIVLLKHVPHGFYEYEIRKYFSQFGKVLNVVLCRSMRTGQSKGYAFIHFAEEDVAKIAAETMDNYLMFKKRMIAKFLTPSEAPSKIFRRKPITPHNIPLKRIRDKMNKRKNATLSETQYKEKCIKKVSKLRKVSKKLSELGIDYSIDVQNAPDLEKKDQEVPKGDKNILKKKTEKANVKARSSTVTKQNEIEKAEETPAGVKKNVKRMSLVVSPKKAKTSKTAEQIEIKEKSKRTPETKKNENKFSLRISNKLEQTENEENAMKIPESRKKENILLLKSSPRKTKSLNKSESIQTNEKIKKALTNKKNEKKSSLKTISKAKNKIKTKTQKKDVKKLKSALKDYMAENFGKSKPKLRSQTVQKK